ncbi:MAG: Ig-like domain-containing protein [Ruminococcus sp.]
MNILIVANKSDCKDYTLLVKSAPNTTVLGAVNRINNDVLTTIKDKYNPHAIIFDSTVKHKGIDISIAIKSLKKIYPGAKIILFAQDNERELFDDLGLYAVVYDTITNLQFNDLLKGISDNIDEDDVKTILSQNNRQKEVIRQSKQSHSTFFNTKKLIITAVIIILFAVLSIAVLLQCSSSSDNTATPDEPSTTSTDSVDKLSTFTSTTDTQINNSTLSESNQYQQVAGSRYIETTTTKVITKPTQKATKPKATQTPSTTTTQKVTLNNNGYSENNKNKNTVVTTKPTVKKKQNTQTKITVDYNNDNWQNDKKEQTQIRLSYKSKTLEVADSFTLTATVTPKNKKVKWSTSDVNIAKIKSTGYVKAVSIGTATITATVDGQSATCTVKVIPRQ